MESRLVGQNMDLAFKIPLQTLAQQGIFFFIKVLQLFNVPSQAALCNKTGQGQLFNGTGSLII